MTRIRVFPQALKPCPFKSRQTEPLPFLLYRGYTTIFRLAPRESRTGAHRRRSKLRLYERFFRAGGTPSLQHANSAARLPLPPPVSRSCFIHAFHPPVSISA